MRQDKQRKIHAAVDRWVESYGGLLGAAIIGAAIALAMFYGASK